jgi:RNA polymerase sigma factor (sigma-70 family)
MADEKKKPESERDHLNDHMIEWAPLINYHVNSLKEGLPPHIDHEDLYAAGMHGLFDAFHKYDPKKGASFTTYASTRIKGRMMDHVTASTSGSVDNYHYKKAKEFLANNKPKQQEAAPQPPVPKKPTE